MVLEVRENNIQDELICLLEIEDTMLRYSIDINNEHLDMHYVGSLFPPHTQTMKLNLTYYVNQNAQTPLDLFENLEKKISSFLLEVDGTFTYRSIEPFKNEYITTMTYSVSIPSYEEFIAKLPELARKKADLDFAQALETKLNED